MAVLSSVQLVALRNRLAGLVGTVTYTKPTVHAAVQAIEDAMTTQAIPGGAVGATMPQYLSSRIDTATAPHVFSNVEKRRLFAVWCELKFQVDR